MRILLVDDEVELIDPIARVFDRQGYQVDVAYDGATGFQLASTGSYDLLILDWMLPHQSGLEICQQLRSQGDLTPVLFLTAKDTLDDRVQGLDAGADDYLVKPFELRELLARVRARVRRSPAYEPATDLSADRSSNPRLRIEDLELDYQNQIAYRGKRAIALSEKESQLLEYLMRHPARLLTHQEIHQHLWGTTKKPSSNVLAAQIRLLRRKIEADNESALIHTVYGKGYRFGLTE